MHGKVSLGVVALTIALSGAWVRAVSLTVLNPSFEAPVVPPTFPGFPLAESWTLTGPGPFVDVGIGFPVNSGTGIFPNPASGGGRFDNAEGNQLAYIFTNEGHQFTQPLAASFEAGMQYQLTVGIGNAGSAPLATDQLEIALFYFNPSNPTEMVRVAEQFILNDVAHDLKGDHLTDFFAASAFLSPGDPAVGQTINILLMSHSTGTRQYVMDNVRVSAVPEPASLIALGGIAAIFTCRRRRHVMS